MRMHKNKDVEHEALTVNDERNGSIQVNRCQKNGQNHRRSFSGLDKRTILIIFFSLISIISLLLLILLSLLLQNNNEANDFNDNGVQHQQSSDKNSKIYLQVATERFETQEYLNDVTKLDVDIPIETLMAEDHKKIRNERPVHIGNELQTIINHRRNAFVLERAFERRFPRDDLSRDQKCRFQPKLKQNKELFEIFQRIDSKDNKNISNDEDKIDLIMTASDTNQDEKADPWELLCWVQWVEEVFQGHEVEKQWSNLGVKQDDEENAKNKSILNTRRKSPLSLSWSDYHARILPNGKRDNDDSKRINREWRRWRLADKDGDNRLTKQEFKGFLFPQLLGNVNGNNEASETIVSEAYEALDFDPPDGRVSKKEFLEIHRQSEKSAAVSYTNLNDVKHYFINELDSDGDGYLDRKELSKWVQPDGFQGGKSEVVYLMDNLDENKSKDLDRNEITKNPDIFLASQLSYNGQLYIDHEFRKKVFVFMRDLDENNGELV